MAATSAAGQHANGDTTTHVKVKSRAQAKRLKKKAKRAASAAGSASESDATDLSTDGETEEEAMDLDHKIKEESVAPSLVDEILKEVQDDPEASSDVQMGMFKDVFAKFKADLDGDAAVKKEEEDVVPALNKGEIIYSDEDASSEGSGDEQDAAQLSKRKLRKINRVSVAELKRLVKRPEVVEWVDVTAQDPRLLICLKSYRNAIPIPQHWSAKRDYLQSKRGIEKPPFQLPSYIADTGIATQRDAIKEKEAEQNLKAKTRERVQPKMGKIDIDYQKLHDAFFKYQTAPKMTAFGEMYYEGKEFETDLRSKRPGDLSKELIEALSIPPLAPPPWLIAMQRYGPPPSYPSLKIPGLNAPIPTNAQWGFHPGGWGKPPVDEFMRPLYGDVFGADVEAEAGYAGETGEPIVRERWGELEPDEEGSEEEEEEEEDDADDNMQVDTAGLQTPSGLATPSGMASVASTMPGGLETPDFLELRKRREGTDSVDPAARRDLYTVVQERRGDSKGFLGSDRTYDLGGLTAQAPPLLGQEDRSSKKKGRSDGVEVALDASELEGMSEAQLRQRYDDTKRSQSTSAGQAGREDLSDVVASEGAKRARRAAASSKEKDKDRFKF